VKDDDLWFNLFASCVLVKGKTSSIIFDLERETFYEIPNRYAYIIEALKKESINNFKQESEFNDKDIDLFIGQFVEKELGFITHEPEAYPDLELDWETPYLINDAIIQIENNTNYNIKKVIKQLEALDCQAFQLRIETIIDYKLIEDFLISFANTRVKYIELIIPSDEKIEVDLLVKFLKLESRLRFIKVYGSEENQIFEHDDPMIDKKILFFKKDIRLNSQEIISKNRFVKNSLVFQESQKHNLGLNRKVSICKDGSIKNYIDHEKVFGNVNYDKIKNVVLKNDFQKKWFISNDEIEKCKDCQYRYSCVSNSDLKIVEDTVFKVNTCEFDPIKNVWSNNLS
jgi:SPASM domain peptide maturase of grasp-with-spasm system